MIIVFLLIAYSNDLIPLTLDSKRYFNCKTSQKIKKLCMDFMVLCIEAIIC